jgi:hypothetical protein
MPRRSKKASQPTVDAVVDEDLVKPTQYHHAANLTELPSIYKDISSKPDFEPLKLEPIDNPGPKLPENVDSSDPELVFRLLWDDSIIDYFGLLHQCLCLAYESKACRRRRKDRCREGRRHRRRCRRRRRERQRRRRPERLDSCHYS